jgi:hypothetical protein
LGEGEIMAIYNGGFPATYQPMFPQYQQPAPQPAQQNQNGIIWVQGEAGAKSYLVAPNTTVQLWDSESQTIYLKSADASGMPSMKVLDYTIREQAKMPINTPVSGTGDNSSIYATKDEIKAVSDQITALRERVDGMTRRKEDE